VPYHYNEQGYGVLILMDVVPYLNIPSHNCYAITTAEGNPNGLIGKSLADEEREQQQQSKKRSVEEDVVASTPSNNNQDSGRSSSTDISPVGVFSNFIDGTRRTMVNLATKFLTDVWPFSLTDKLKDFSLLPYFTGTSTSTEEKLRSRAPREPTYIYTENDNAEVTDDNSNTWVRFFQTARKQMFNISGSFLQFLRDNELLTHREEKK